MKVALLLLLCATAASAAGQCSVKGSADDYSCCLPKADKAKCITKLDLDTASDKKKDNFDNRCCKDPLKCCYNTASKQSTCCLKGENCVGMKCVAKVKATDPCRQCVLEGSAWLTSVKAPQAGVCERTCTKKPLCNEDDATKVFPCSDSKCIIRPSSCPIAEFTTCSSCIGQRNEVWDGIAKVCVDKCPSGGTCHTKIDKCDKNEFTTCRSCTEHAEGFWAQSKDKSSMGCFATLAEAEGSIKKKLREEVASTYHTCPGVATEKRYETGTCYHRAGSVGYSQYIALTKADKRPEEKAWVDSFKDFVGMPREAGFCSCDANCGKKNRMRPTDKPVFSDCCADKEFWDEHSK